MVNVVNHFENRHTQPVTMKAVLVLLSLGSFDALLPSFYPIQRAHNFHPKSASRRFADWTLRLASSDVDYDAAIAQLEALRGTPELVDRLESLVQKYPGVEIDVELYRSLYPFKLDAFQEDGIKELIDGKNVIVTTPTGSGKTLVGELAIYFALMMGAFSCLFADTFLFANCTHRAVCLVGLRVAYTTPLKALSNQKFADFKAKFGGDRVGLLTGGTRMS